MPSYRKRMPLDIGMCAKMYQRIRGQRSVSRSSVPAYSNLAQSLDWLETMIASPHNGVTDFVIELINTDYGSTSKPRPGPVIGKLGCWDSTDVLSFILNKSFWGKGYASDALQAFSWYMFAFTGESQDGRRKIPADKLIADVDPRNKRSRTLLKRCGFVEFGRGKRTRKTHLGWCDSIYYELTRERWEFLNGTSSGK